MKEISPGRVRLAVDEARDLSMRALRKLGYNDDDAGVITDHVVNAALCGYEYSGPVKILNIAEDPRSKKPRLPIAPIKETAVSLLFDGGGNVGMLAVHRAVEATIKKALESGICVTGVTNSWMSGRIAHYTEMIAKAGLIGVQTEATRGGSVAPPGGTRGTLGTNPISFAFPTADDPFVFDMGTAAIMTTDLQLRVRTGEPLPDGVAIDAEGNPTQDAAEARKGATLTFGGHKGYGLSLVVAMLGTLAGSTLSTEKPHGGFIMAFKPDLLASANEFRDQASKMIERVKKTPRQKGVEEIRVPSQRAFATRRLLAKQGIEIDRIVYDGLMAV